MTGVTTRGPRTGYVFVFSNEVAVFYFFHLLSPCFTLVFSRVLVLVLLGSVSLSPYSGRSGSLESLTGRCSCAAGLVGWLVECGEASHAKASKDAQASVDGQVRWYSHVLRRQVRDGYGWLFTRVSWEMCGTDMWRSGLWSRGLVRLFTIIQALAQETTRLPTGVASTWFLGSCGC